MKSKYLLPLWMVLCFMSATAAFAQAGPENKTLEKNHVLLLLSTGQGNPGVETFVQNLRTQFIAVGLPNSNLHVEYLALDSQTDVEARKALRALLLARYRAVPVETIITVQQAAMDFVLRDLDSLAPGKPVIAAFVRTQPVLSGLSRPVAVRQQATAYGPTLKLALDLFPATKRIELFVGAGDVEKAEFSDMMAGIAELNRGLQVADTRALSFADAGKRMATTPPDTIIIAYGYNRDTNGRALVPVLTVEAMAREANAPVFVSFDVFVGRGPIGGVVATIGAEAVATAQQAAQGMLAVNRSTQAQQTIAAKPVPMFDWLQWTRWRLDAGRLPPGAMVINRPPTLWGQYRREVIGAAAFMLLLLGSSIALLIMYRRREQALSSLVRSEQTLRDSEDRLSAIVQGSPMGITVMRMSDGVILEANEMAQRILGFRRDEMVGHTSQDLQIFRRPSQRDEALRLLRERGRVDQFLVDFRTKDGATGVLDYSARSVSVRGEQCVMGVWQDITERMAVEQKLRESESRFREMFQNHASIMLLINPDSLAIVDANEAAARFYGYPVERLLTMSLHDINTMPPADMAAARDEAVRLKRNYFILPHRLASGEMKTVESRSTPITIGGETLLFSIVTDITERQRAEEALMQRTRDLVARNEELTRFSQVAVDRELRMIELKNEVNALCAQVGEPARYGGAGPADQADAGEPGKPASS